MSTRVIILAVLAFIAVLLAGFTIGSAGGAEWGTFDAGCLAFVTILAATIAGGATAVGMHKWH